MAWSGMKHLTYIVSFNGKYKKNILRCAEYIEYKTKITVSFTTLLGFIDKYAENNTEINIFANADNPIPCFFQIKEVVL